MSHFFYSLIKFCIGLIFIASGIAGMLVPWSAAIRTAFIEWLLEGSMDIMLFSFGFFVIGVYLVIYSLQHARIKYHRIKIDDPSIQISETLVQDYLGSYWKSLFPSSDVPCKLEMRKKKIAIQADLPFIPMDDQKELLQRIENDLSELFRKIFGYRHRLDILISFNKK